MVEFLTWLGRLHLKLYIPDASLTLRKTTSP